MSGAEVLVILPIVAALISAFKDGSDLGDKARSLWRKHRSKKRDASQALAEDNLGQSLVRSPQQIKGRFDENVQRFGPRFNVGDDTARMELMQCLLDMYRDMLRTSHLMLENKMEYDPIRLLQASDHTRSSTLRSFDHLAQRLAVQAPVPRPFTLQNYDDWGPSLSNAAHAPTLPGISRVQTIASLDESEQHLTENNVKDLAKRYVNTLPPPSSSPQLPSSEWSSGVLTDYNAFCKGPVEESYYSGSLSLWQCHQCGSSISFDYNRIDRSMPLSHLIFACHLPVKNNTAQYRCILCAVLKRSRTSVETLHDKMELLNHLGEHDSRDFKEDVSYTLEELENAKKEIQKKEEKMRERKEKEDREIEEELERIEEGKAKKEEKAKKEGKEERERKDEFWEWLWTHAI